MANKAVLTLNETEYDLDNVNFSLNQNVDYRNGKPVAEVAPGQIVAEVRVDQDNITQFWKWAKSRKDKQDGSIKFFKIDEDASLFELSFKDGFCVALSTHMDSSSSSDMVICISVAARVLEIDGEALEMKW